MADGTRTEMLKCRMCGGDVTLNKDGTTCTCLFCGSTMVLLDGSSGSAVPESAEATEPISPADPKPREKADVPTSPPAVLAEKKRGMRAADAVGDVVVFGRYPQDGPEPAPIRWKVLAVTGELELLISEEALEVRCYHSSREPVRWEESSLRAWLNGPFLKMAFDESEHASIHAARLPGLDYCAGKQGGVSDRVFLLSPTEAKAYLPSTRDRAVPARARLRECGAFVGPDSGNCRWWLRSPSSYAMAACFVESDGSINTQGTNIARETLCVRPALFRYASLKE